MIIEKYNPGYSVHPSTGQGMDEFQRSNIPDELTLANIEWASGDEAIAVAIGPATAALGGHATQYATKPVQRLNAKYDFLKAGCWYTLGTTIDGREADVPCIKPTQPRPKVEPVYKNARRSKVIGFGGPIGKPDEWREVRDEHGQLKRVKYETPSGCPGLPMLAYVPEEFAQAIYEKFDVTPIEGETFWQVVQRCNITIAIVEGIKKALALIAQGIPAIAIRGIGMWHVKGSRKLHQEIAQFAIPGRRIYVCFDQDDKPKTVKDVRYQALALGFELQKLGPDVRFLHWDKLIGKGIDDALYTKAQESEGGDRAWLQTVIDAAMTLRQYRRMGTMARAFSVLDRLERLSYPVERETEGEYLPQLPPILQSAIHVLDVALGGGKTYRTGKDWIAEARKLGWFIVALSPMNALGQQTAERWNLPHIHDFDVKDSDALWATAVHQRGIVLCPDSLHHLPGWVINQPILLVMDEANQVEQELASGDRLGDRHSMINLLFKALATHAAQTGAIVLAEDGIADRAVKFAHVSSSAKSIRIFKHHRKQAPWDCTMYSGNASGYRARAMQAVTVGQTQLYVTSSQREAKRYERAILSHNSSKRIVRIDSETNEGGTFTGFFNNPDQWIATNQPDVLILSPSAKSGISIEAQYFDAVWGYFPSLAGDTHWQMLGRYRLPVPRHIFCPPFITAAADEALMSPRRAKQRYQNYAQQMAGAFDLEELLTASSEDAEHIAQIETAVIDFHATQRAVQGAQKAIAYEYLLRRLEKAGHRVSEMKCSLDRPTSQLWTEVQESIWRDDATEIAAIRIEPSYHKKDADRASMSNGSSKARRLKAQKFYWRAEFPGVLFDDIQECYEALCLDYGAMRRGVLFQVQAENLNATKQADIERARTVLTCDVKALHRLPKKLVRATLIAKLGVLKLLDGKEYCNHSQIALAIKKQALDLATPIREFLGLNIRQDQTPSEIANKLLRKLGLEIDRSDRPGAVKRLRRKGGRGEQRWVYAIDLKYSLTRSRLLDAARRKVSESFSHDFSSNIQSLTREIIATTVRPSFNSVNVVTALDDGQFRLRLVSDGVGGQQTFPDGPTLGQLTGKLPQLRGFQAAELVKQS